MSGEVVVDTSVAFKWFVNEVDSEAAFDLLSGGALLVAPDLLRIELGNALWKTCRQGATTLPQSREAFATLNKTIARWYETAPLIERALQFALEVNHPIYDLCYLALADTIGTRCVTADARLIRAVSGSRLAALVRPFREFSS